MSQTVMADHSVVHLHMEQLTTREKNTSNDKCTHNTQRETTEINTTIKSVGDMLFSRIAEFQCSLGLEFSQTHRKK